MYYLPSTRTKAPYFSSRQLCVPQLRESLYLSISTFPILSLLPPAEFDNLFFF